MTVSGTVRYEDIGYSSSGWTGNNLYKPVRHAIVDLLDSCGNTLTSSATDSNGAFLFNNVTLAAAPLTVRVMAESDPGSGNSVAVRSMAGAGYAATYSLTGANLTTPQNIDISKASGLGGVFNMLDIYQSALEFAASHAPALSLPQLNVYWKNTIGSYTCSGYLANACKQGMGIYVYSVSSDQDEYDDDVLWHEFAHFVEYAIDASDSPGGTHLFTDNDLDLRLAWSEGHADYLQTAIKRWLRGNHPERLSIPPAPFPASWYIDTDISGAAFINKLDMANPDPWLCGGFDCYIHASNEVAVANALWHGSEAHTEPPYWAAFASHLPTVTDGLSSVMDNLRNLEAYWDGLLLELTPLGVAESAALTSFSARSIYYATDAYEPDDAANDRGPVIDCASVASGVVCVNESHILYRGAGLVDLDVVPISVTSGRSYTVTTAPMLNGLDSYLEILDTNGTTVLASNDDAVDCGSACSNDGAHYASGLTYTPSASGTLYVRVKATPYYVSSTLYRGWGAGAYGGYTLKVTAN